MTNPLISVIMPVYNIRDYLPDCMRSVLAQTYQNLDIILVDDGSTDGSGSLCDSYIDKDPRVRVCHKTNGGLSDARNYGIERALGEYITLIDPDDSVDPDYVEYLYRVLDKYGAKMSICTHRVRFDNGRVTDFAGEGDILMDTRTCLERMLYHDVIDTSAWAKLYHKSLFDKVRFPLGNIFEDIGTTYALMLQMESIAVGFESKYTYYFHNNSIVNSSFSVRKLDMLKMTDRMARDVLAAYPDLRSAVLRRRVYARLSTLNQMIDAENADAYRERILAFIRRHAGEVLRDPRAPKRDKAALLLLRRGYPAYCRSWKLYRRISKGF